MPSVDNDDDYREEDDDDDAAINDEICKTFEYGKSSTTQIDDEQHHQSHHQYQWFIFNINTIRVVLKVFKTQQNNNNYHKFRLWLLLNNI